MITRDEWLAAIEAAKAEPPPNDPNVLTTAELADVLGVGRCAAERAARNLVNAGSAERTTKVIRMVNGGLRTVPAYRLIKTPESMKPQSF